MVPVSDTVKGNNTNINELVVTKLLGYQLTVTEPALVVQSDVPPTSVCLC